mmetsp:Transcript_114492/g.202018  ORF Transcript_114492/g.202018 Transcript_114492/m.202018 type:complete len:300 (+) Transcript_114492:298-1197(+)
MLEDVYDALWAGMDIPEKLINTLHLHQEYHLKSTISRVTSQWALLGPFDSGTNLFGTMVRMNFGMNFGMNFLWKHTTLGASAIIEAGAKIVQAAGEQLSDVVLVLMVRSPISQIVSWKKASYNLKDCLNRAFADMGHPCTAVTNCCDTHEGADTCSSQTFSSTMDAYNTYLQQFQELRQAGAFKDVLLITYEDLVLNPAKVMRAFGHACEANIPSEIKLLEAPAKDHGDAVGREAALAKLATRSWMNNFKFDAAGLEVLCKGLDRSLIKDIVEGTDLDAGEQVPYSHDCGALAMLGEQA